MISRRDKLLNQPWEQQRYEQHRLKVNSAKAAVDVRTPQSYAHVTVKPKKLQTEKERMQKIEAENVRLLQKLGAIMKTKRLPNFWLEPRPNFLSRETLFQTRPRPSTSAPQSTATNESSQEASKSPKSRGARRCPSCSGCPERTIVEIPEKRIPWEPPRKSWNRRERDVLPIRQCMHCGHAKKL